MKKILIASLIVIIIIIAGIVLYARMSARVQVTGVISIKGLSAPVTVSRDGNGMAYIEAKNIHDALRAQGFIAAQDRLFQMELTKLFSQGRICELAGEKARNLDIRMRTLGFYRNGKKHAAMLAPETRKLFQSYIEGVNHYIQTRKSELPLEFKLAGIKPGLWTIEDSMAIIYYMGWSSAANIQTEMITQMLVEKFGPARAAELLPLNINPDEETRDAQTKRSLYSGPQGVFSLSKDSLLRELLFQVKGAPALGSNNWVVNAGLSESGKPIVSNDPHLESGTIPGHWHAVCLVTPETRSVGVIIAGIPGILIGRNEHIAVGITNSYSDAQDLYIESVDPADETRYLEGGKSIPFTLIKETLKIRDKKSKNGFREEAVTIKLTKRGPVVSGVLPGFDTKKVVTVRWSPYETMDSRIGLDEILYARNAADLRKLIGRVTMGMFNFVYADRDGNIGWQTSGRIPVRSQGDSTLPFVVKDGRDNWVGWIPFEKMPHSVNPARGWFGTCNHKTITADYPYYLSSYFSPSYRYRRLKELMARKKKTTVNDHWAYQRDATNMMARELAPLMAKALLTDPGTEAMGKLLSDWDHVERHDTAAPLIFQAVYCEFAFLVFRDEMGPELTKTFLDVKYYWKERLHRMVVENSSPWFDDISTPEKETRDMLFRRAAVNVKKELSSSQGSNPAKWQWGKVHRHEFNSALMRKGLLKGLFGGGSYPMDGSAETLYRASFKLSDPYLVNTSASLRMVVDLADSEKVPAVLPGGVNGRAFNPHTTDQIKPYMNGRMVYWWFSDGKIRENAKHRCVLKPE
ncbi:MAG TPA: penicillin acylase family protein [Spirochaetes bacterium]|nr:penicillin acylase family protein [Spirochaetota bacterium]